MTFGGDVFVGSVWERFRSSSMYQQFIGCIGDGRIQPAATIWTRHHSEFGVDGGKITRAQLGEWLDCIPERAPSAELRVSSNAVKYMLYYI